MDDNNPYRPLPSNDAAKQARPEIPLREPLYGRVITLAQFDDSVDAHLFRNELEANGVNAAVTNESSSSLGATLAGQASIFTIDVMIMESDSEAGLEIKKRWFASNNRAEVTDENEMHDWVCSCGETVDEGFEICWNCGSVQSADESGT